MTATLGVGYGYRDRMTSTEARERLAELLTQELGVGISPEAVKRLIERRWNMLSPLAHAAHDNYERPATANEAAGLINQAYPSRREPQ